MIGVCVRYLSLLLLTDLFTALKQHEAFISCSIYRREDNQRLNLPVNGSSCSAMWYDFWSGQFQREVDKRILLWGRGVRAISRTGRLQLAYLENWREEKQSVSTARTEDGQK